MEGIKQMTDETKIEEILTLDKFIKDLQAFPQDSEVVGGLDLIGMTISINRAISFTSEEGKKMTVIMMDPEGALRALEYASKKYKDIPEDSNAECH
jgi:hypothetical protein